MMIRPHRQGEARESLSTTRTALRGCVAVSGAVSFLRALLSRTPFLYDGLVSGCIFRGSMMGSGPSFRSAAPTIL